MLRFLRNAGLILFVNITFATAQNDTSSNKTDSQLRASLIPWSWAVRPDTPNPSCASPSSVLGTFAVVNIIVTLCTTIFGDRRVIHFLTRGLLGSPTGNAWRFTFILPLGMQLGANAIVAYLYSRTVGYVGKIPIGQLVLFFTTRPRLGYIFLTWLIPYGRKLERVVESPQNPKADQMTGSSSPTEREVVINGYYEASAKGSMLAEVFLLIISTYYYGRTVHFAASHGYYIIGGRLSSHPHAKDASLMYGGAMFALLSVCQAIYGLIYLMGAPDVQTKEPDKSGRPEFNGTYILRTLIMGLATTSYLGAWLFWAGYIKLAGDLYCPPKLVQSGAVWSGLSLIGVALSGGH